LYSPLSTLKIHRLPITKVSLYT